MNFVQVGIDLGGMIRAGHPGWTGWGGHGSGRKLPIVFAGLLLGDEQLANINQSFPKASFGEDEQTAYGDCWTGAKVVFAGHSGHRRSHRRGPQSRARRDLGALRAHAAHRSGRQGQNTERVLPPLLHQRRLGRAGAGAAADARREGLGPRRLLRLRAIAGCTRTTPPSSRRSRKRPATTTTPTGRGRARRGTPSSTRCGPSTAPRSPRPPTAGSSRTTTVTTARRCGGWTSEEPDLPIATDEIPGEMPAFQEEPMWAYCYR